MIDLAPRNKCTGCGVCAAVCSRQAITLQADEEGFAYPRIDANACITCHRCHTVCPVLKDDPTASPIAVLAARSSDKDVLTRSSSGGIFTFLSEAILDRGGVVYGAELSADMRRVVHCAIHDRSELPRLLGSKYVQSDLTAIYKNLKKDVQNGVAVLFSGAPCQVAAVRALLGKDADKIISVEMICHAVPSPLAWNAYVSEVEHQEGCALTGANFRDKTFGWKNFGLKLKFANGKESVLSQSDDPYLKAFLNELINRPSCHNCSFRSFRSGADLTIGDYWGKAKSFPEAEDDRGLSVVLVNTIAGQNLFDAIRKQLHVWDSTLSDAIASNSPLVKCTTPHPKRSWFFKRLNRPSTPFSTLVRQAFLPPLPRRIRIYLGGLKNKLFH